MWPAAFRIYVSSNYFLDLRSKSYFDHLIVPSLFIVSNVISVPDANDLVHTPDLYSAGPLGAPRGLILSYSGRQVKGLVDNNDSGYLGMAVQLYVQAHLGHYHKLAQKDYSQKLMAQLKTTPLFTYMCLI